MMQGFDNLRNAIYMIKILNMILEFYLPTNPKNKHHQVTSKLRLGLLQGIMKDCGLLSLGLSFIKKEDLKLSNEVLKLLTNMLA